MRISINRYQLLLYFILLFLLVNLFRDMLPSGVNQFLGGIVVIFILVCIYPLKLNELRIFFYYMFSMMVGVICSDNLANHIKYSVYFIFILAVYFACCRKDFLETLFDILSCNINVVNRVIFINTVALVWLLGNSNCYSKGLWNGAAYFQGFSVPHGAAGSSCLAVSICILLAFINKKYKYLYSVPIFINIIAIFKTGARTYLFAVVVLAGAYIFVVYKSKFQRISAILLGFIAFIAGILTSKSFIQKMEYSKSQLVIPGFSKIDALTSSRSIIWSKDIRLFFTKSNIMNFLVGGGFDYSYELNEKWTYRIQAHNGFLEVLLSTGVIGFVIYLVLLGKLIKFISNKSSIYMLMIIIYLPVVIFFDDILQAPSYVMSSIFVCLAIWSLKIDKTKNRPMYSLIDRRE